MTDGKMARVMGAAGIGIGVTELVAPRWLGRKLGVGDHPVLTRAIGVREVASGLGILVANDPHRAQWSRVIGDILDVALVALALRRSRNRKVVVGVIGAIAVLGAIDLFATRER